MKWRDLRDSIFEVLESKIPGVEVYSEDVDKAKKPCYFVDLVDYKKEFNSHHREWKGIILDIRYHPKNTKKPTIEIIEALETLDDAFEIRGNKVLHARHLENEEVTEERWLTLHDVDMTVVDEVGHYVFTLSLFDLYGKPYDYELMQDLELNLL